MTTRVLDYLSRSHLRKAMGSFFIAGVMFMVIGCLFAWVFFISLFSNISDPVPDGWMVVGVIFIVTAAIFAVGYGCLRLSGFLRIPSPDPEHSR